MSRQFCILDNMLEFKEIEREDLWYFVGLLATDGCLSSDGRHVIITSKDLNFLESLRARLKISNCVGKKRSGLGLIYYQIQIGGVDFYQFLEGVGLTPRKSLTLGKLLIDDKYLDHFLRGVIDGDGSIRTWLHPTNGGEQWSLRIYSGSQDFIAWLRDEISSRFEARGVLHKDRSVFVLKFGKMAAQKILKRCYPEGCLSLEVKRELAVRCSGAYNAWSVSKTIGQVAERYTRRTQNGSPWGQL